MSEGISDDNLRSDSPAHERHRARRTVLVGLVVFVVCAMLTFSPLLLGRGGLNRFIVAFSLVGVMLGGSFMLHGAWDWLRAGRRR
ncbi:MAG TPA: hypothetical protein VFB66_01735 [Tepidisphaeraceae bacterium]|nr:hypothetical protein [Tepidisphaeraceae bacterium]